MVTFPGEPNGQTYQFAAHVNMLYLHLVLRQTHWPDFVVFIDTTDGTLATASVGVCLLVSSQLSQECWTLSEVT